MEIGEYSYTVPYFVNAILSFSAYAVCCNNLEAARNMFLKAGLKGRDYGKSDGSELPEGMGVVAGTIYLVVLCIFIPGPYLCNGFFYDRSMESLNFELTNYLAALVSICCMILLGFADDVLDLRWRHKLCFPMIASIPLMLVYFINNGSTSMKIPFGLNFIFGSYVDLGWLYYVFVMCLAIFCTNSINILSGINGLEVGQSVIICISIIFYAVLEIFQGNSEKWIVLYIITPFLAVSLALFKLNKYPASLFVGDTFCYFAGMTFAVVGILGHFSKIILLFFIPQIINFIISIPQLFGYFPCPRHRLPKEPSKVTFYLNEISLAGCVIIGLMARFNLATVFTKPKDIEKSVSAVVSGGIAFIIIYPISWVLYLL